MLVAPILAILAYFLADYAVSEKPHRAKKGTSYKLIAKSNCRYTSGKCELHNGDFIMTLKPKLSTDKKLVLTLETNVSLDGVKLALNQIPQASPTPSDMKALDATHKKWQILINPPSSEKNHLQLVASAHGSLYFADVTTVFFYEKRPYKNN